MADLTVSLANSAVATAIMRVLTTYGGKVSRGNLAAFLRRDRAEVEPYLHELEVSGLIKSTDGHVILSDKGK